MTPYLIEEAQARYDQHIEAAVPYRLTQEAQTHQLSWHAQALVTISNYLIALGQRVHAHSRPAPPPGATTKPPAGVDAA